MTKPAILPKRSSDDVLRLLCTVSLWRTLAVVQWPLGKLIALLLLVGRPVRKWNSEVLRQTRHVLGWLWAPSRHPALKNFARDFFPLRHYHFLLGKRTAPACRMRACRLQARTPRRAETD